MACTLIPNGWSSPHPTMVCPSCGQHYMLLNDGAVPKDAPKAVDKPKTTTWYEEHEMGI
jgi:hypothetical protein